MNQDKTKQPTGLTNGEEASNAAATTKPAAVVEMNQAPPSAAINAPIARGGGERKRDKKRTKKTALNSAEPAASMAQQPSETSNEPSAASAGPPAQIKDPFENVHQTLARPLETGPIGKNVVPFKVPILKRPPKGRWCTIHPNPEYRMVVSLLIFDRDEVYLVHPSIASEVETDDVHRRAIIYTGVLRPNCAPFLWYVPVPQAGERDNDYWASARTAAEAGMSNWIRLISDTDAKCYHYEPAELHTWPVLWPEVPFGELLRRGFQHPGRFMDTTDHPVLRELHGQAAPVS